MGAVGLGLAIGGSLVMALWGSAKKKAARAQPRALETEEERKKRERDDERERRRRSDVAKFLADPRFLK